MYKILIQKPERKRILWRIERGWEDSIGKDHKGIESENVDWITLVKNTAQLRTLMSTVKKFRFS